MCSAHKPNEIWTTFLTRCTAVIYVHKIKIVGTLVCVFVCLFVCLYLKNRFSDLHQTCHAYSLRPEKKDRGSKLRKSVLSSFPGEGVSCSSETKHDRRTAPRRKLFVSKRRLQKQRPEPRKLYLVRLPTKMISVVRKLSTIEERRQVQSYLFGEEITGTKVTTPKNCPGFES
jgi:hypothetical protein